MITYKVEQSRVNGAYFVVAKESGVVVSGPHDTKNAALADANLRASALPGNRVES